MRPGLLVMAFLAMTLACGDAEEGDALRSVSTMDGEWVGTWTESFFSDPIPTQAIRLQVEVGAVVSGNLRDPFQVSNRDVLFDGRENGRLYDEGEGLLRTDMVLDDGESWALGFILDQGENRALIADFFFQRLGAVQRGPAEPQGPTDLEGRWAGRFAALDNANPSDAELEAGRVSLDCSGATCRLEGEQTAVFDFPGAGPVWIGTASGLTLAGDSIPVRGILSPDRQMLALAACPEPSSPSVADLFCAYAALSRE